MECTKVFLNDETLTQRECKPEDNGTTSLKYRREKVSTYSSVPSSNNVKNESELKTFQIHKG